jgi:hypothetical protein
MAREQIPVTQLVRNAGTVVATAGTIDTSNGHYIASGAVTGDFILWVDNTGDEGTVSILPGDNPPSLTAASGTVEVTVDGTAVAFIKLETGRVTQDDGQIHINFESGMAGSVAAYEVREAGVS